MTVDVTTKPRTLESYVGGEWVRGTGKGQTLLNAATGAPVARIDCSGIDFAAALAYGPRQRRPEAAQALLPRARRDAEGARPVPHGAARRSSTPRASPPAPPAPTAGSTSRAASARCSPTPPRPAASCPNARVLTDGDVEVALQGRDLLRPAHPHAARRRRHPHQRLQLPGLGHAGEGRPDLHRRRPVDREAGQPDRLPDRARRPPHRRDAASCPRARCSSSPAPPATCSTT